MEPGLFGAGVAKRITFDGWFKLHHKETYLAYLCKSNPEIATGGLCKQYKAKWKTLSLMSRDMFENVMLAMKGYIPGNDAIPSSTGVCLEKSVCV